MNMIEEMKNAIQDAIVEKAVQVYQQFQDGNRLFPSLDKYGVLPELALFEYCTGKFNSHYDLAPKTFVNAWRYQDGNLTQTEDLEVKISDDGYWDMAYVELRYDEEKQMAVVIYSFGSLCVRMFSYEVVWDGTRVSLENETLFGIA